MSGTRQERPKIVFRTDSSAALGAGHLRRCLTVAEVLGGWGCDILFVCRANPDSLNSDVVAAGFDLAQLPARAGAPSEALDAEESRDALAGRGAIRALVVDHYGLSAEWERAMRPRAERLVVIDDLANRPHDCDVLIDVTPPGGVGDRYAGLLPDRCDRLLGPAFAMLRPEFRRLRRDRPGRDGRLRRILVSFGATDADNRCGAATDAVRRALGRETEIHVVLGRTAPHKDALADRALRDEHLHIHVDIPNMAELMAVADLAIGAAGTTSWERACLGLSALAAAIADNQRAPLAGLEAAGCAIAVDAGARFGPDVEAALAWLAVHPTLQRLMGEAGLRLVDGRGAERVARAIRPAAIGLRPATEADSRDLWVWRNDERVRLASKDSAPIDWETHRAWFTRRLEEGSSALLIAEDRGEAVGVVRFDLMGGDATISLYLTPWSHGRGLGPALIRAGEKWLRANHPDARRILADILPHNPASVAAFEAADYVPRFFQFQRELSDE